MHPLWPAYRVSTSSSFRGLFVTPACLFFFFSKPSKPREALHDGFTSHPGTFWAGGSRSAVWEGGGKGGGSIPLEFGASGVWSHGL